MNYILDSNTVSDIYDKDSSSHQSISKQLSRLSNKDQVYISVISLYEFEYGYNNAPENKKNIIRKKINEAKEDFTILPLNEEGALLFGKLKKALVDLRKLKKENAKKHNIDIMLASTAILKSCTLISADGIYSELKKLEPKLMLANWAPLT